MHVSAEMGLRGPFCIFANDSVADRRALDVASSVPDVSMLVASEKLAERSSDMERVDNIDFSPKLVQAYLDTGM